MTYASIDALRSQLGERPKTEAEIAYAQKQLHAIPDAPVVKRRDFILERVTGKSVLEFGASGPMHEAIMKVAANYLGVDRVESDSVVAFDLDEVSKDRLPDFDDYGASDEDLDIIVCGEVLEHLGNPQWFLTRLRRQYAGVPVIVTVPNAHCASGLKSVLSGTENCNRDHVAWYSFVTLRTLLERVGYSIKELAWYNGAPRVAEGLIVVTE